MFRSPQYHPYSNVTCTYVNVTFIYLMVTESPPHALRHVHSYNHTHHTCQIPSLARPRSLCVILSILIEHRAQARATQKNHFSTSSQMLSVSNILIQREQSALHYLKIRGIEMIHLSCLSIIFTKTKRMLWKSTSSL